MPPNNTVAATAADSQVVDATDTSPSKEGSRWAKLHARINGAADNFFYRLGYWVATHPKRTLLISLVLVIACCFGFANFSVEADGEELWVPADSLSKRQETIVTEAFTESGEFASFLVESPTETGSVLTKESVDAIWELDAIVKGIESGGKTYQDVCSKQLDGVTCEHPFRGVTRFWSDFDAYEASVTSDEDVLAAVNVESFPDGQTVNHLATFGNTIVYDDAGNIISARAMVQGYSLNDDDDDATFDWNGEFQDAMDESAGDYQGVLNVFYLTSRSIDDALAESVGGEIFLFITTYIVMIVFVSVAIGRCCSGSVERRSWLGVGGVMIVIAAGLAAYGINSAFSIPFTSLSQILPFILVGIGVDDMFVVVAAYDHTDPALPIEERVALGSKRCGVSVTYTSLTNFFAFILGSTTLLPAVEYFCLYAATAILFDFLLQMTAFVALLTMDANRQKAGKIDWCCCFTSKKYLAEHQQQEGIQRGVNLPAAADAHHDLEIHELSAAGKFMRDKYAPLLLSVKGKVLVLLAAAGLLGAGIYGVTQATQGFDVLDLAPDDHFSRAYTELARDFEVDIQEWYLPLNVVTREVDYPDVTVQAQIQATDELMLDQEFVTGPQSSWLTSFVTWAENSTEYSANVGTSGGYSVYADRDSFYPALSDFLSDGTNTRFEGDIVFTEDGTIEISRTDMFLIDLTDTDNSVDALEDARDVVDQSTLDPEPFGYSGTFVFTEQFLVIYDELLTSFGLALIAVFALSLIILGKIGVVVLVCLTVFMIDVELLGFLYHWNLDVNSITVIQLIMAVGLVVDYMVHIVHYFLHQDSDTPKDTRIADALGEIGPSILVGAMTTFLGIMPLAFANNVIFRVFFKMFLIIISFGFFHGVVFVPVMLSILPDRLVTPSAHPTAAVSNVGGSKPSPAVGDL